MGVGAEGGRKKSLPDQRGVRIVACSKSSEGELTTQKYASLAERLFSEVLNKLNNLMMCSYVVRRFANQVSCWLSKITLLSIISAQVECSVCRVLLIKNTSVSSYCSPSQFSLPRLSLTHTHIHTLTLTHSHRYAFSLSIG